MRVLFIGSTKRGYMALKTLYEYGAKIVGVISLKQDNHEVEKYENQISNFSRNFNIPLFETKWLNDKDYQKIISNQIKPDIAFVVGCRILIPKNIYSIPPKGMLGVHDSFLPEYRGFAPLNWSIINGEDHTGVSLFYLDELTDCGDIVAQKSIPIGLNDTAPEVYDKVCQATIDVIIMSLPSLASGNATLKKQEYSVGSFTCKRNPEDGIIDWSSSSIDIYNLIRAVTKPYPGAFTYLNGKKILIWKAQIFSSNHTFEFEGPSNFKLLNGDLLVKTGDDVMIIDEYNLESTSPTKKIDGASLLEGFFDQI